MTVSANYSTPVQVNGFPCKNCTDVDYARKHIDPAHPKSGPYGVDASTDPSRVNKPTASVSFGGSLTARNDNTPPATAAAPASGSLLDLSV